MSVLTLTCLPTSSMAMGESAAQATQIHSIRRGTHTHTCRYTNACAHIRTRIHTYTCTNTCYVWMHFMLDNSVPHFEAICAFCQKTYTPGQYPACIQRAAATPHWPNDVRKVNTSSHLMTRSQVSFRTKLFYLEFTRIHTSVLPGWTLLSKRTIVDIACLLL